MAGERRLGILTDDASWWAMLRRGPCENVSSMGAAIVAGEAPCVRSARPAEVSLLVAVEPAERNAQRETGDECQNDGRDCQRHECIALPRLEPVAGRRHDSHTSVGRWSGPAIHREQPNVQRVTARLLNHSSEFQDVAQHHGITRDRNSS